jgi:hypothetical protein
MVASWHQNAEQNHISLIANKILENMAKFKYLGTRVSDETFIHEEMKSRLNSGNVCYNPPRHENVLGKWKYSSTHSLTSALDGGTWSASRPGRFTPRERAAGTHCIGGWVGPRAVLEAVVKRNLPSPHRESNHSTPIAQPVASRYTDWAITNIKAYTTIVLPFVLYVCKIWSLTLSEVHRLCLRTGAEENNWTEEEGIGGWLKKTT